MVVPPVEVPPVDVPPFDDPPDDPPFDELPVDPPPAFDEAPLVARARASAARLASCCAFLRLASAAALARATSSLVVDVVLVPTEIVWTLSFSLPSSGAEPPRIALDAIATLPTTRATRPTHTQPTFDNDFTRDHLGQAGRDGVAPDIGNCRVSSEAPVQGDGVKIARKQQSRPQAFTGCGTIPA